jgi:hypothetical protein
LRRAFVITFARAFRTIIEGLVVVAVPVPHGDKIVTTGRALATSAGPAGRLAKHLP